jgi:CheY-like chemotaxis protein
MLIRITPVPAHGARGQLSEPVSLPAMALACGVRVRVPQWTRIARNRPRVDHAAMTDSSTRLLVAEDDDATRTLLKTFVTKKGFVVTAVGNGTDALAALQAGQLDLAVLDVMMPGLTGLEVLERTRGGGVTLPILLATALGSSEDVVRGLELGADDYVTKPFDLAVLVARVQNRLKQRPPPASVDPSKTSDPSRPALGTLGAGPRRGLVLDGRYEPVEQSGEGSFGVVWRACHQGLQTDVAIKFLRPLAHSSGAVSTVDSRGHAIRARAVHQRQRRHDGRGAAAPARSARAAEPAQPGAAPERGRARAGAAAKKNRPNGPTPAPPASW